MTPCLFCQIVAGEIPCSKIYEDDQILAFLDIHPLNPGHTLLVPKKHAEHLLESSLEDAVALISAAKKIVPAIMASVGAQGCNVTFNIGHSAGQVVFHTHLHVIPRYDNDGYKPWERNDETTDSLESIAERIRDSM